ncbi:GMP/IMP nucleotidase [Gammaproteobacteria bacterium]|jgi:5'-nucleotidase|nr:GMP/IMP nucleotidase [Pseudomonadota bacterium]MDB0064428.1 GMP/IMP nucleotidase [Gammaproteobacteria bacterium]
MNSFLDWQGIDTVLLDMDGTLMDLGFDNFFWHEFLPERYAQLHGLALEPVKADLIARYRAKSGSLQFYCTDYWSAELGLDIVSMKHEVDERIQLFPLVTNFLMWLRDSGKRVVLCTNAHLDIVEIKMAKTGISHHFDRIISSHSYGHAKESQQFWEQLQQDEKPNLKRTLLVDDNVHALSAAEQYGVAHLISIWQPDSTEPVQDTAGFAAINDFSELVPELRAV